MRCGRDGGRLGRAARRKAGSSLESQSVSKPGAGALTRDGSRIVATSTPVRFSCTRPGPRAARPCTAGSRIKGGAGAVEEPREVQDEEHERVWERVAAVDVAKGSGVVCTRVPDEDRPGRRRTHVWTVPARARAVIELGDHLRARQIQVVTLESTSDYWRIWFVILEAAGLTVQLVNARTVKNVPGRAKTDLLTELQDVSAAQARCTSRQPIADMSGKSESAGCYGRVASPIATETGHTRLNQPPGFSSLPIFDVSRSTS